MEFESETSPLGNPDSVKNKRALVGFKTRWAAALLALLCVGTAFGVHLPIGDEDNMIHFYKNLVMTGGFLYVIAFGAGAVSIDGKAG